MGQEGVQEEAQLLAALCNEVRVEVAEKLLLGELWRAIRTLNILLDEGLEFPETRVPVFDVEDDVFWSKHLDGVDRM